MTNHSNAEYLTLRHLFVAYARMLASREMFPAIRDFHAKRCRILTGLFEIQLQEPDGLAALAKCYTQAAFYDPCGGVLLGSNGVDRLGRYRASMRQIRRHAADMRRIYARLGVEWLAENYPGIEKKRVHVSRLKEFNLSKPPTKAEECEECIKAMENDEPEPVDDDVPASVSDDLKRGEEVRERARRETEAAIPIIIERALAAGIGTPETVSQIICDMNVRDFLKITAGFPNLSRVDFQSKGGRGIRRKKLESYTEPRPTPYDIACRFFLHFHRNVRDRGYDAYRVTHQGEVFFGIKYDTEMVLLIKNSKPFKVCSLEEFVEKF